MNDLLGGRYRVVTALGRGGMGTVYEAVQEGLGRHVALKVLDLRLSDDREQLERFRREAEVVAALGHPNIVQVTDFQYPDEKNQQPFLVMELLRGESLGSRLAREQVLPAGRVAFIAAQVLSALVAAHRAGIVHRDIKPDNIFLLADAAVPDTVKVLDFGIAKLTVDGQAKLTGTGAMLGTPAFMAPEQARGADDVDARADVYAVGATMYQALSGRLPYEAPSIPALLFAIVEKTPVPLHELRPDLPSELVAIIERAMAKDRAARFPDADTMRRALAPWSGLPASIPPPISATAATISSGEIAPYGGQTPIVVNRTPALVPGGMGTDKTMLPAEVSSASAQAQPPQKKWIVRSAIVFAVLAFIVITKWFSFLDARERRESEERRALLAKSSTPSAIVADTAIPSATVMVAATNPAPSARVSVVAPGTTTHAATVDPPAISAAVVASATSTTPPAVHKRYGGKTGYQSSSSFSECDHCDWEGFRNDMAVRQGAIDACFAASEHEPPIHENPDYEIAVTASGIMSLKKAQDGAPNLDRCLVNVVMSAPLKKPSGGPGSFRIGFRGECTRGWVNHCD